MPVANNNELTLSKEFQPIANANIVEGIGRWSLGIGSIDDKGLTNGVILEITKDFPKETASYQSVLEWELIEEPIN